jgi:hypothetical protein
VSKYINFNNQPRHHAQRPAESHTISTIQQFQDLMPDLQWEDGFV